MNNRNKTSNNTIDFNSARSLKEFVTTANDQILKLEHALYSILETDRIDVIKEIAADAVGEDIDIYLEQDNLDELDFDDDTKIIWEDTEEDK